MRRHFEGTIRGRSQRGQTLIMAIIILGVLLVIGFLFLGIINRNISFAGRAQQRSVATDLADAGVKYAHSQLLNSALGADWRPTATPPLNAKDPDFDLLQPNGPDGLGAYSRVPFDSGRAIIRVRYAPSDASIFQVGPAGALREPGKARNYIVIESFGRPGRVTPNDPTTLLNTDRRESRKQIAFCSIGFIESARFITDKHDTSRPAEIGWPNESGARYDVAPVNVPIQIGDTYSGPAGSQIFGGGSFFSNTDLVIHGRYRALLNAQYADSFDVAGTIVGADANARLDVQRFNGIGPGSTNFSLGNQTAPSLDSRNSNFSTLFGVLRDGLAATDSDLWTRHIGRKEPGSILRTDPNTNVNRYVTLSRDSGAQTNRGNNGRWGHGRNVYVDNRFDLQIPANEEGREETGTSESLFFDWLNPNNGQANSGWQGPFYVPIGAFVQLDATGFTIIRDGRSPAAARTWRRPDGTDSGLTALRYRIGIYNGRQYIVNTLTPGVNIDAANPGYQNGVPFDGVLFFEGNVRVRGVIPTDVQLTLVSMGNIYIEGSITKGVTDLSGARLTRPSASMLALMAKDYVVLNTTQFFGPSVGQALEEVSEVPGALAWNPIRMRTPNGSIHLRSEFLLDPASGLNPSLWTTYLQDYRQFVNPGSNSGPYMDTKLVLSHTMDDGAAPASFFNLDVNFGLGAANSWTYNFALTPSNGATPYFPTGTNYAPIYGLGGETWQRYAKFETIGFPLIHPTQLTLAPTVLQSTGAEGNYSLLLNETSTVSWRPTNLGFSSTNDYVLARAAIVPHDIRIDAAVFAEEGCFFVIPGQWFNPNPNDRRDTYQSLGATPAERQQARLDAFGSFPETPFYGEPNDVKVTIVGSVAENMPPPISQQAEWLRKWGWIPREHGATGELIPWSHVPQGFDIANGDLYVPNLTVVYDSALATARLNGFDDTLANPYIRVDNGRPLPPLPRLPVSPTLAYFGEVNP